MQQLTIIGGGIAGLSAAISLQQQGFEPLVFEAAPEIKPVGAGIVLAANALKAYRRMGIAEEMIAEGKLISAFTIYDQKGSAISKTGSSLLTTDEKTGMLAIHRGKLLQVLHKKIDLTHLILNKRTESISREGKQIIVHFEDGTTHETDALIVAEGIHSPIRKTILPNSSSRYAGYTCWRAVLEMPELEGIKNSETWGRGKRFGIVPLPEYRIYWFACINAPQADAAFGQYSVEDLRKEFNGFHDPIPQILAKTKNPDLFWNDIIDLKPIKRFAFDNIVLIGDAAHAMTPNMGQGACQAIEDAYILADEIQKEKNIPLAFKNFEKRRIKRTHAIVRKSWMMGRIAQLENKTLAGLRNFGMSMLPAFFQKKQLEDLYKVDF